MENTTEDGPQKPSGHFGTQPLYVTLTIK